MPVGTVLVVAVIVVPFFDNVLRGIMIVFMLLTVVERPKAQSTCNRNCEGPVACGIRV